MFRQEQLKVEGVKFSVYYMEEREREDKLVVKWIKQKGS